MLTASAEESPQDEDDVEMGAAGQSTSSTDDAMADDTRVGHGDEDVSVSTSGQATLVAGWLRRDIELVNTVEDGEAAGEVEKSWGSERAGERGGPGCSCKRGGRERRGAEVWGKAGHGVFFGWQRLDRSGVQQSGREERRLSSLQLRSNGCT